MKCFSSVQSLSHVWLFVTLWTVDCQTFLSMGIFQARILEWVAFPTPGDLPDPGIKLLRAKIYKVVHYNLMNFFSVSSVQLLLSCVWLFVISWTRAHQVSINQPPELAQIHVHQASDAIQPSHSLLSPFPPALNLSQHQGLFKWVSSSHQVAKVLEFQLQHWSFQYSGLISFRVDWVDLLAIQGTLRVFSKTTLQKYQFFGTQLSL